MAVNTLHTTVPIDSSAMKIISDQAIQLITQIQKDIKNEEEISTKTHDMCNTILQDAHKKYIRIQIEFVEETKILITAALQEPNIRFHETWLHAFNMFATRCEQIAGPILQVLNAVALESNRLKHKYSSFVAGATASSVVSTALIGGLIVHYLPATVCGFTLTAGGVALAASGALLAAGLAIAFIIGAMNIETIRAVYDKCTSELQLLLTKYLPCIFNEQKNVITKEELNQAIKNSLNEFQIKEDVWTNVKTLEMLQRSTSRALDDLKTN